MISFKKPSWNDSCRHWFPFYAWVYWQPSNEIEVVKTVSDRRILLVDYNIRLLQPIITLIFYKLEHLLNFSSQSVASRNKTTYKWVPSAYHTYSLSTVALNLPNTLSLRRRLLSAAETNFATLYCLFCACSLLLLLLNLLKWPFTITKALSRSHVHCLYCLHCSVHCMSASQDLLANFCIILSKLWYCWLGRASSLLKKLRQQYHRLLWNTFWDLVWHGVISKKALVKQKYWCL